MQDKRLFKIFTVRLLVFLFVFMAVRHALPESMVAKAEEQESRGVYVMTPTQAEIKDRLSSLEKMKAEYKTEPLFTAPYSAGELTDKTLQNAIDWMNTVRFIAGIPDTVTLNSDYNELTQASSLVNFVNHTLSHYPEKPNGMDEDLYQLGYDGSGSSNIAARYGSVDGSYLYYTIVSQWMYDGDSSNIGMVGHRRWILNPSMKQTGFGSVWGNLSNTYGSYSAMYTFDNWYASTKYYGVAWPAHNMPITLFDTKYPWSISMGKTVSSDAKVSLTRMSDGAEWTFEEGNTDFYINNSNYGQKGCIIFRPSGILSYAHGDVFKVVITGTNLDVMYYVNFFDPDQIENLPEPSGGLSDTPSPSPTLVPSDAPTTIPTATPTTIPTATPTAIPTVTPTTVPTATPTTVPTATPTTVPTATPTAVPTATPKVTPSVPPSASIEEGKHCVDGLNGSMRGYIGGTLGNGTEGCEVKYKNADGTGSWKNLKVTYVRPLADLSILKWRFYDDQLTPGQYLMQVTPYYTDGSGNKIYGESIEKKFYARFNSPENFTAEYDAEEDGVVLRWDKVNGASGYVVVQANTEMGSITKLGQVTDCSFTHKGVDSETEYVYAVYVYSTVFPSSVQWFTYSFASETDITTPKITNLRTSYFSWGSDGKDSYNGHKHSVLVSANRPGCGEVTVYYALDGTDEWTKDAPVNAGTYIFAIDVTDGDEYSGAEKIRDANWKLTVKPAELMVVPDDGIEKFVGESEPELTFNYSGNIKGEIPGFEGSLSRKRGASAGKYEITQGSLSLKDNGDFLASNYTLAFDNPDEACLTIKEIVFTAPVVEATEIGQHSVKLEWEAIPRAYGYIVFVDGDYLRKGEKTIELEYVVTELDAETEYLFKVYPLKEYDYNYDYYDSEPGLYAGTVQITTADRTQLTASDFTVNMPTVVYDACEHEASVTCKKSGVSMGPLRYEKKISEDEWKLWFPNDAGTYRLLVSTYGSKEYADATDMTDESWVFNIHQKEVELQWYWLSFDYDGEEHIPVCNALGISNYSSCSVTVTGAQTEPGTYTATASTLSNKNYKLPADNTVEFTINAPENLTPTPDPAEIETIGDVNSDEVVDPKDVTLLRRYLAGGWGVSISEKMADIDQDGDITPKDVTLLRRYLAGGWGVELPSIQ